MGLSDQVYTQKLQNFQQKYHIFDAMKKYIFDDTKILVSISGGSDSILLSLLIYHFFIENKIPLSKLHFIHFNHNTRLENKSEESFICQFLSNLQFTIFTRDIGKYTEESLRKRRYKKLEEYSLEHNIDYVCLGHNLDDRLESTLLNMMRGCDINGFLSMKIVDTHPLLPNKIYRPMIFVPKKEISDFIQNNQVGYVQDQTNFDPEVSMRNHIRKYLIPHLVYNKDSQENKFYSSLSNIYMAIPHVDNNAIQLLSLDPHPSRGAQYYYKLENKNYEINNSFVFNLFKKLNISNNISQKTVEEFSNFFKNSNKGFKCINGVYFFIAHSYIYIIKATNDFRKIDIDKKIHINKLDEYNIDKIICKIDKETYLGGDIVYAKSCMSYKNKTRNKYCINKKIPIFWRQCIPVLLKNNEIQKIFIPKYVW